MKIAYGTMQGSAHRKLEYNNQDAVEIIQNDKFSMGIITDGCGNGSNSEVGAQLGIKKLSKLIKDKIESNIDWKIGLKEEMQQYTKLLASMHDDNTEDFIRNYMLYTLLGFVKTKDSLTVFSYGDGIIIINDDIQIIDQNNRPRYINNEIINSNGDDFCYQELNYKGQNILIGTDGVNDLIEAIDKNIISEYSSINEFMKNDKNYTNPIKLPKFLQKYSHEGILKDDCTIIMLKE